MSENTIYTIGYEGSNIEDFIATLVSEKIAIVIDIRDRPLSRKKGFSKNGLAEALDSQGIGYIHLKGLGDPKEGRDAARSGDMEAFENIFTKHMATEEAQLDLQKAIEISSANTGCFLCFEREPKYCHRNIVVKQMTEKTGQEVVHIGVQKGISEHIDFLMAAE